MKGKVTFKQYDIRFYNMLKALEKKYPYLEWKIEYNKKRPIIYKHWDEEGISITHLMSFEDQPEPRHNEGGYYCMWYELHELLVDKYGDDYDLITVYNDLFINIDVI